MCTSGNNQTQTHCGAGLKYTREGNTHVKTMRLIAITQEGEGAHKKAKRRKRGQMWNHTIKQEVKISNACRLDDTHKHTDNPDNCHLQLYEFVCVYVCV